MSGQISSPKREVLQKQAAMALAGTKSKLYFLCSEYLAAGLSEAVKVSLVNNSKYSHVCPVRFVVRPNYCAPPLFYSYESIKNSATEALIPMRIYSGK